MGVRSDLQIYSRAVKQRWPVSDAMKQSVAAEMERIVTSKTASERAKISAAKVLISAEAQNQSDEHIETADENRNRFSAIAQRLGIRITAVEDAEGRSGGDIATVDGPDNQSQRAES